MARLNLLLLSLFLLLFACSKSTVVAPQVRESSVVSAHPTIDPISSGVTLPKAGAIAPGVDGTIADIYQKRVSLQGKQVVVSGQVVKYSAHIMNRNWIHLQDGTSLDMTVTSNEEVKIGDVVVFKGKLSVDKDIGSGYFYQVLLEDAVKVKKY